MFGYMIHFVIDALHWPSSGRWGALSRCYLDLSDPGDEGDRRACFGLTLLAGGAAWGDARAGAPGISEGLR